VEYIYFNYVQGMLNYICGLCAQGQLSKVKVACSLSAYGT